MEEPGAGLWESTTPTGTPGSIWPTRPMRRPTWIRVCMAWALFWPTTSGTVTRTVCTGGLVGMAGVDPGVVRPTPPLAARRLTSGEDRNAVNGRAIPRTTASTSTPRPARRAGRARSRWRGMGSRRGGSDVKSSGWYARRALGGRQGPRGAPSRRSAGTRHPCRWPRWRPRPSWRQGSGEGLDPEAVQARPEGVEEVQLPELVRRDPAGLRRLPGQPFGHREALGDVQHDGPVAPPPMVVLVDGDQVEVKVERPDLLGELAQRALQGRLAPIQRTPGDGPGPALVGVDAPAGEEVPGAAVRIVVADQDPGCSVASPPQGPVADPDEAVTRAPAFVFQRQGPNHARALPSAAPSVVVPDASLRVANSVSGLRGGWVRSGRAGAEFAQPCDDVGPAGAGAVGYVKGRSLGVVRDPVQIGTVGQQVLRRAALRSRTGMPEGL